MGVHLYDESPSGPIEQHTRLTPARALVQAGIPCVVWAEDALSFVHFVPTGLFTFQILVPDELLEHATDTITSTLPCYRRAPVPEGYQHWVELRIFNPSQPPCFPNAIPLEVTSDNQNVPEHIIVHPASFWSFNMHDLSKTTVLSPAYHSDDSTIRFPALHAFIDSMITTILEPPGGLHMRSKTLETRLRTFLGYLFTYTPAMRAEPPLLPDGSLELGLKGVYEGIGEENRPYFMSLIKGPSDWAYHAAKRREILHKLDKQASTYKPSGASAILPHTSQHSRALHTTSRQTGTDFGTSTIGPRISRNMYGDMAASRVLIQLTRSFARLL